MSILVLGAVAYDTIETPQGRVENVLGGSASYFALAARFFAPISIVAVIGADFRPEDLHLFNERDVDTRGMLQREGETMRWQCRYHDDMNRRDTLGLQLNVFANFSPELLPQQRNAKYIFLGNICPQLQRRVLEQIQNPQIVAADTMGHWIESEGAELKRLLPNVDILTLNDDEARTLSGEHNLLRAGRAILKMGPDTVLVKRGEYGVLQFSHDSIFVVPAYPLEEVADPTGAGDTFAGGLIGAIAQGGQLAQPALRSAVMYGSVLASFAVERFSLERLLTLTLPEIRQRYEAFVKLINPYLR